MTPDAPWIRRVEDAVEETKVIPLWGTAPEFLWDAFSQELATILEIQELKIQHKNTDWRTAKDLFEGLGENPLVLNMEATPLGGEFYWVMGREDSAKLTRYALSAKGKIKGFVDRHYEEGFYRYVCLEAIDVIDNLKALSDLSLKIKSFESPSATDALCIDVSIQLNQHTIWGRIVCPRDFLSAFRSHFSGRRAHPSSLAQKIDLICHLEIGSATLKLEEWKKIQKGDFLLLDRCSFDPNTHKGVATLTLGSTPLLQVRIKEDQIKILEHAFYHEETMTIDDEDEDHEEDEIEAEPEKEIEAAPAEEMIATHEIPINVTVEIARLKMPLDKLLELKPGNSIDLSIAAEASVSILANGKRIAQGELIKMGDAVGVKILEIGNGR